MYNYKSRWDGIKRALTEGLKESKRLKLEKDYHNISPVLWYMYIVGVVAGMIGGILWSIILAILIIIIYLH